MSDLQIGLALLGVLMVAAVLAFNWWQERKFRRRGEETFSGRHEDVLLDQAAVSLASMARISLRRPSRWASTSLEAARPWPGALTLRNTICG